MNRPVVYSFPTGMSSLTVNHSIDLLYLLKENFKYLLMDLLITGSSFENLIYLSSCSLSQRWRFLNVLQSNEWDLTYTNVSGVASQYILWSGNLWYPIRSRMLKTKQLFFISSFKINTWFVDCTTWYSEKSYRLIRHKE